MIYRFLSFFAFFSFNRNHLFFEAAKINKKMILLPPHSGTKCPRETFFVNNLILKKF